MSAAWFGLLGVVVGALISTGWSWFAVVRAELNDGMVAARVLDNDLAARQIGVPAIGDAKPGVPWMESRAALARVLGKTQWAVVSSAYEGRTDPDDATLAAARAALGPLVASKRDFIGQRRRNLFGRSAT